MSDERNPPMTADDINRRLHESGILATPMGAVKFTRELTDAERASLGYVPPGTPTTTEIIAADRGDDDRLGTIEFHMEALRTRIASLEAQLAALLKRLDEQDSGK